MRLNLDFSLYKAKTRLRDWWGAVKANFTDVQEAVNALDDDFSKHTHGNITNDGKIGSNSGYAVYTTTGGKLTAGSLSQNSPSASNSTADAFIDSISQNPNGKINPTKKKLPAASASVAGITKVDVELSDTSTNPVQNKVITSALTAKANSSHTHNTSDIISGTLPVERGGTGNTSVDTTPISRSTKMVTSGGVYTALSQKANASHTHTMSDITGLVGAINGGTVEVITVSDIDSNMKGNSDISLSMNKVYIVNEVSADVEVIYSSGVSAVLPHAILSGHAAIIKVTNIITYSMSGDDYYETDIIAQVDPDGIVDSALSDTSTNPVQNKIVKAAIDALQNAVNDTAPENHQALDDTYGAGGDGVYGHVQLSDATDSDSGTGNGTAATPKAVKTIKTLLQSETAKLSMSNITAGGVYASGNIPDQLYLTFKLSGGTPANRLVGSVHGYDYEVSEDVATNKEVLAVITKVATSTTMGHIEVIGDVEGTYCLSELYYAEDWSYPAVRNLPFNRPIRLYNDLSFGVSAMDSQVDYWAWKLSEPIPKGESRVVIKLADGSGDYINDNVIDGYIYVLPDVTAEVSAEAEAREAADEALQKAIGYKARTATIVVASSTSKYKNGADFVCTGTADQNTINAAIAALPSAGGKVVLLEGTYNLTGSINAVSNLTLEGMGWTATVLSISTIAAAINISGVNNVEVRDLQIVKANPTQATFTAADNDYTVTYNNEGGWTMGDLGKRSRGIYITNGASQTKIVNVSFNDLWVGVCVYGSNRNIIVERCVSIRNYAFVSAVGTSTYNTHLVIHRCTAWSCRSFIGIWRLSKIIIENNIMYNSASTAIYLNGTSASNPAKHIIISDNILYNIGDHGINCDANVTYSFIQDNYLLPRFSTSNNSGQYPIRLTSTCSYNYIMDNYIAGEIKAGNHYLDQGTNNVFSGNTEA